jgi:hypothetical protein
MPAHPEMPRREPLLILGKRKIFDGLRVIDNDPAARDRVLTMETEFRRRIDGHLRSLPPETSEFAKFNTSPFVLIFWSKQRGYKRVYELEKDIVPGKVFSSMETSAGRMVETVALPVYGWEAVSSSMHSSNSVLDGQRIDARLHKYCAATLKSGPRCLNDEMAKDIGRDVASFATGWAQGHGATIVGRPLTSRFQGWPDCEGPE